MTDLFDRAITAYSTTGPRSNVVSNVPRVTATSIPRQPRASVLHLSRGSARDQVVRTLLFFNTSYWYGVGGGS